MLVKHFLSWKDHANVAKRAAAASALARAYLQSDLDFEERAGAEAALTMLLDDPSPKVRHALAEALASSAHAPAQIVTGLVHDQPEIAALVIARSPVVCDRDLVERVRSAGEALQCLVAKRPEVSNRLALAIARHGCARAGVALLANANARVCGECLLLLANRHGADRDLRGALLDRADLPAPLRYRLLRSAGDALAASPLVGGLLGADHAGHLLHDARQRALHRLMQDTGPQETGAVVAAMREAGDLTTLLMVRAACFGQVDFLAGVLAEQGGVPIERVTAILVNERRTQMGALFSAAGFAPAVHPVFLAAVELWRQVAVGRLDAGPQEVTRLIMERIEQRASQRLDAANDDLLAVLRTIHLDAMRANARAHAEHLAAA